MSVLPDKARFASLFVKRGLCPDLGGLYKLPKIVGPQVAAELLFTGRMIDADAAKGYGLVSRVVPHAELMATAQELAAEIAANPPLSLRKIKEGLSHPLKDDPEAFGSWIMETLNFLFTTEDHKEGVASFIEKRAAEFHGALPARL